MIFSMCGVSPFLYDNKEHQYRFWDNHFDEVSDMVAEQSGFSVWYLLLME